MSNLQKRLSKIEKVLKPVKKEGINTYEQLIAAIHEGRNPFEIETPYIKRCRALAQKWIDDGIVNTKRLKEGTGGGDNA